MEMMLTFNLIIMVILVYFTWQTHLNLKIAKRKVVELEETISSGERTLVDLEAVINKEKALQDDRTKQHNNIGKTLGVLRLISEFYVEQKQEMEQFMNRVHLRKRTIKSKKRKKRK